MNWKITLGLVLVLNIISGSKSYAQREYFQANHHYKNFEYELAIPLYKEALSSDSTLESIEQLADCYRLTHQYKEALKHYAIALNIPYYTPISVFYYAEMLFQIGNYDEALNQYELYKNYEPDNITYLDIKIESCKIIPRKMNQKLDVSIENIKEINTKFSESGVFIGGKNVYFSSNKKNSSYVDIDPWTGNSYYKIYSIPYQIKNSKLVFQKPKPFHQNINTGYHSCFPTFNLTENKIYYTSTKLEENPKKNFEVKANEFINKMNITEASLVGKKWLLDSNLKTYKNFQYSVLHPCLSEDGTRLYFASDMPGGYGSYDIYYLEIDSEGKYSDAINLGDKINSSGAELYPSFANSETLYFSSTGKIGFGGLDIYKAEFKNNTILNVENIGFPINSSYDDYSFFPMHESNIALMCSDREGGKGKDDIYKIEFKNK